MCRIGESGCPTIIRYVLEENQLARLYHDRPEDAWPGETVRALCKANDPNGDWDYTDAECSHCAGCCTGASDASRATGEPCGHCPHCVGCEHCGADGREPVSLELCLAALNDWLADDPTSESWFRDWLARNAVGQNPEGECAP